MWNYLSMGKDAPPPTDEGLTADVTAISRTTVQHSLTKCNGKFHPRGITVGFPEGSVLFDADRLSPAAVWWNGFVRSEAENYFGLRWHPSGDGIEELSGPHVLAFRLADDEPWQASPLPLVSDPNDGDRFDGYIIGKGMIMLHYRLLAGNKQVAVVERIGLDARKAWRGFSREITVTGLPAGARVALSWPTSRRSLVRCPGWLLRCHAGGQAKGHGSVLFRPERESCGTLRCGAGRRVAGPRQGIARRPSRIGEGGKRQISGVEDGLVVVSRQDAADCGGPGFPMRYPQVAYAESRRGGTTCATGRRSTTCSRRADEKPFAWKVESIPGPSRRVAPNGTAFDTRGYLYALAMTNGKVWRTPLPGTAIPKKLDWHLYASGLNHPIGLNAIGDRLFVSQKPELTELIDSDGSGTVNRFRTVMGSWGLSDGYHEYAFGIGIDREQSMYVALNTGFFWTHTGFVNPGRFRGSIMRVDRDGRIEEYAKGCRVPNGVGQGPNGDMFFTDNQGDWIQVCKLAHIQKGRFYGHPETRAAALPKGRFPDGEAACWLPYDRCRSASTPAFDETGGKFGPFTGQFFVGDVGYGDSNTMMRVALEKVEGDYQGAAFMFSTKQVRGPANMRFGPDHHLYVSTLSGGLMRICFGGKTPMDIHHVTIRSGGEGFVVHFTKPLAEGTDVAKIFRAWRWHYLYTGNYGSPDADKKDVPISKAEMSADRRSVTLTLPVETHPIGMTYYLSAGKVLAEDGDQLVNNEAWYTVNRVPKK